MGTSERYLHTNFAAPLTVFHGAIKLSAQVLDFVFPPRFERLSPSRFLIGRDLERGSERAHIRYTGGGARGPLVELLIGRILFTLSSASCLARLGCCYPFSWVFSCLLSEVTVAFRAGLSGAIASYLCSSFTSCFKLAAAASKQPSLLQAALSRL